MFSENISYEAIHISRQIKWLFKTTAVSYNAVLTWTSAYVHNTYDAHLLQVWLQRVRLTNYVKTISCPFYHDNPARCIELNSIETKVLFKAMESFRESHNTQYIWNN